MKVRKEDLSLIKEVVEPARTKFNEASLSFASSPYRLKHRKYSSLFWTSCLVLFLVLWLKTVPFLYSVTVSTKSFRVSFCDSFIRCGQVYGQPAPEVTVDEKKFLPPAPKSADDEESESW